jgi:hypothetical protein
MQKNQTGKSIIEVLGKPLMVSFTRAARKATEQLDAPLWIEMELYFSCLVRKAVRFHHTSPAHAQIMQPVSLTETINLLFRPVVTEHCSVADVDEVPDLETMPANKPAALVPRWLNIDFKHGQWHGEFGY